jgi:alanyl aminopeptidase
MVRARFRFAVVVLLVAGCKTAPEHRPSSLGQTATPTPAPEPKLVAPQLRLPDSVRPLQEEVSLRVVPGEERFDGSARIALEVTALSEMVWLHGAELELRGARLAGATVRATAVGGQFIAVVPTTPLEPGHYDLELEFSGVLSKKDISGLFQLVEEGRPYAYTQFEAIDARRAFPCFDEPSFKIPWTITLTHRPEHLAVSNTPVAEEHDVSGMKVTRFAQTRPLPSYLVAFAVGPFDLVDAGRWGKNKVPVRIVTPKGKLAETRWAVESTGPILEQLEGYFGIPYPYEKLDQLAVPVDFGAMENPGLVTYTQRWLLSRVDEDTPTRQRLYAGVAAHELAHQWFGDLVTMAWWDDLWLNEAFATWMAKRVIAAWRPSWDADVLAVESRGGALTADGLANARQVRQPILSNDDIENAFDGITYGKGASVIAMFESWVTPQAFQKGVSAYLAQHAFGSASAADFLSSISTAAGIDVSGPFNTFLEQPGAPRVSMELSCLKSGKPTLLLRQRRHLPVGSKADAAKTWAVPICVRYAVKGKVERACTLLAQAEGQLELPSANACPDWVLPNDSMRGHYRASLSGATDLATLLSKGRKQLSVAERVGVLDDMKALVASGELDLSVALATVPLAASDENRHLVEAAASFASSLNEVVVPEALKPKAEQFVRLNFGARAKKLGLQVSASDDEDTRLLRPSVVGLVARAGKEPALRRQALELAVKWVGDRRAVHPDLVETVLSIAADTGDPALHSSLLEAVKTERDLADRNRMLGALSAFPERALVERQLRLALGDELDPRESMRLVWGASKDVRTRDVAVAFVENNWDALIARLPKDSGAGLVFVASGYCDEKLRDQVQAFFEGRSTRYTGGPRDFALALEGIDLCIAYRDRQRPVVTAFLERWKP